MRLHVAGNDPDSLLAAIHAAVDEVWLVGDAAELRAVLEDLAARSAPEPRSLDLIGHASGDDRLLRVARLRVDGRDPGVVAGFVALRTSGVLARLGVTALRLLGCCTAMTAAGRATILALADALALPVFGTTQPLYPLHFTEDGLKQRYGHLLISDAQLRAA